MMNLKSGFSLLLSMLFGVVNTLVLVEFVAGGINNIVLAGSIFLVSFCTTPYFFGVLMYKNFKYELANYFKLVGAWFLILASAALLLGTITLVEMYL